MSTGRRGGPPQARPEVRQRTLPPAIAAGRAGLYSEVVWDQHRGAALKRPKTADIDHRTASPG